MATTPFLLWQSGDNVLKTIKIDGRGGYLGRLVAEDYQRIPDEARSFATMGVYYVPLGNEDITYTGIVSPTVSRRHVLLKPEPEGLYIRDHGSGGSGSKNGTFVNASRLPPGGSLILKPGNVGEIQLGSNGPIFHTAFGTSDGVIIFAVEQGVPVRLPRILAYALKSRGWVEEFVEMGNVVVVRLKQGILGELQIEGTRLLVMPELGAVMAPLLRHGGGEIITGKELLESLKELKEHLRDIQSLLSVNIETKTAVRFLHLLTELLNALETEARSSVKALRLELAMDSYREFIRTLGEDIYLKYEELLYLLEKSPQADSVRSHISFLSKSIAGKIST